MTTEKITPELFREMLRELGRIGGKSRSKKKKISARRNLEKALSKRWGRPIRLK